MDRSALLREVLRRYLARLNSEVDAERWETSPPSPTEVSLEEIADWGPAEAWPDWVAAAR